MKNDARLARREPLPIIEAFTVASNTSMAAHTRQRRRKGQGGEQRSGGRCKRDEMKLAALASCIAFLCSRNSMGALPPPLPLVLSSISMCKAHFSSPQSTPGS